MHEGPHLAVDIGDGYEREAIHFYNTPADRLEIYELIHELQQAVMWLQKQDPDERVYGPHEPPSEMTRALMAAYRQSINHMMTDRFTPPNTVYATKKANATFYFHTDTQ